MTVPHQKDSLKAESNEKIKIAMSSIAASVTLTIVKLVVGSYTNSLGILSEAMHSGLDIIATVMTYQAVRMALRPPDTRYTYGYAKFESIASLVEIILLFAVAAWVFNEGIDRIFFKSVEPEITVFSFAIMFISIAVDFGRSRVLYKAARKYGSQALEADGLHFKTDMFTSAIVIAGLLAVALLKIPNADAYSAITIAALIIYTSLGLGRRTLDVLLDKAPKGSTAQITQVVSSLDGIKRVYDVRARKVGQETFVDMHVEVPRTFTHDRAHRVATEVEERVKNAIPNSNVLVHVDAIKTKDETILDRIRLLASENDHIKNIHSVYLSATTNNNNNSPSEALDEEKKEDLHLYLDVQMDASLDLASAHNIIDAFERQVKSEIPEIKYITTHIETEANESIVIGRKKTDIDEEYLQMIRRIALSSDANIADCKDIGVTTVAGETHITMTITIPNTDNNNHRITIEDAHRIATRIQNMIIKQTGATRVVVHTEPA
jgi:cation diffusion facilitator family transporter